MKDKFQKGLRLLADERRFDRARALFEIKLNQLCIERRSGRARTITFENFLTQTTCDHFELTKLLASGCEADAAVSWARSRFEEFANQPLPFPSFYNADRTLALLSYALVRYLRPNLVVESGVGYGFCSALVLLALDLNRAGKLASIDLPSLGDPTGSHIGRIIPDHLKERWSLLYGSSRNRLPSVLSQQGKAGLFISDSANVYTLQRYEFETVYPSLDIRGAALFNNIGGKFQTFLQSVDGIETYSIRQTDKPGCATALILKK